MIRECTPQDIDTIDSIINEAALAYRGAIPDDCWHDPYMTREHLQSEIAKGVHFFAYEIDGTIAGVMGLQDVHNVTLIRHAYVRRAHQGRGIGGKLLDWLIARATNRLLVGTWAAATWAIAFYERHGFRLVTDGEKNRLLDTYWTITPRQRDVSVVLEFAR